jgi:dienelactone hydrolase
VVFDFDQGIGFPGPDIAAKIKAPILALLSKDEPESDYAAFKPALKVDHSIVHFPTMVHGWLSARGDLAKLEVRKEFDKGYDMMLEWFGKHL